MTPEQVNLTFALAIFALALFLSVAHVWCPPRSRLDLRWITVSILLLAAVSVITALAPAFPEGFADHVGAARFVVGILRGITFVLLVAYAWTYMRVCRLR